MVNIVCCIDHNFVQATTVMLCSLCENTKRELSIHMICDKTVSEEDKTVLKDLVYRYHKSISYYTISKTILDKYPKSETLSESAYYRLFIQEFLPSNIDKIIYLDGDIIVRGEIGLLWDKDISNVSIGAVIDFTSGLIEYYNRLGYPSKYGYFNSGVLLINLKKWREIQFSNSCRQYIYENYEKIKYHDQDVLNVLLIKDMKWLPITFNFQNGFMYKKDYAMFDYSSIQLEIKNTIPNPLIVHFTSADKPWKENCKNPFAGDFFKYRNKTTYKNHPLLKRKRSIKGRVLGFIQSIGLLPPNPEYDVFEFKK